MAKRTVASGDSIQDAINKKFGDGTVMSLGEASHLSVTDGVSTGSPKLDMALGGFGFPFGKIIEIIGPESCSKTSIAMTALGNAQKRGMKCIVIDAENALDPTWCENLGVDLSLVKVSQPSNGEEGIQIVDSYLKGEEPCFIVVDSVAALVPKKELEGEVGDVHVGLQARLMSQSLRIISGIISNTKSIVVFINQLRSRIGGYGNPETTPGGLALKYYAACRIDLRRIEVLKERDEPIGIKVRAKIIKNKCSQPFKEAVFSLYTDGGISKESDIFDLAVEKGLLVKSGSWIKYEDASVAHGENNAIEWLKENPEIRDGLVQKIKAGGFTGNPKGEDGGGDAEVE